MLRRGRLWISVPAGIHLTPFRASGSTAIGPCRVTCRRRARKDKRHGRVRVSPLKCSSFGAGRGGHVSLNASLVAAHYEVTDRRNALGNEWPLTLALAGAADDTALAIAT